MRAAISAIDGFLRRPDERCARRMLYRLGPEAYADGVALAFCWSGDPASARSWRDLQELPGRSPVPSFPLGGRDVLGQANIHGPAVGALLKQLESWWVDGDFTASEADLRSRLQQMVAAAQ